MFSLHLCASAPLRLTSRLLVEKQILLVSLQSFRAKLSASALNQLAWRGLSVIEGVIEIEFLPFEATHLMKRKHVYALDVAKAGGELCDLSYIVDVVG
jgi:hypothetical protein